MIEAGSLAAGSAQLLKTVPDKIEFSSLPDQGVRIALKPQRNEMIKIAAAELIFGICSLILGFLFHRFGWMSDFQFRNFGSPATVFTLLGFALIGIFIFLMLIFAATGPGRDVVLEIHPGRLKIDRYAAGDHIVREYSAADVRSVSTFDGVMLGVPIAGEVHLGDTLPDEIVAALVVVIATGLWQESAVLLPKLQVRGIPKPIPFYACDASKVPAVLEQLASGSRA